MLFQNNGIKKEKLRLADNFMMAKYHLLATNLSASSLTLAMVDLANLVGINEVKFLTGYYVRLAVAEGGPVP